MNGNAGVCWLDGVGKWDWLLAVSAQCNLVSLDPRCQQCTQSRACPAHHSLERPTFLGFMYCCTGCILTLWRQRACRPLHSAMHCSSRHVFYIVNARYLVVSNTSTACDDKVVSSLLRYLFTLLSVLNCISDYRVPPSLSLAYWLWNWNFVTWLKKRKKLDDIFLVRQ